MNVTAGFWQSLSKVEKISLLIEAVEKNKKNKPIDHMAKTY